MTHGYPDYATPYGEVLTEIGNIHYVNRFSGSVAGGSYADLHVDTIPAGINVDVNMVSNSADGCEAYHMSATYVNAVLAKAYYFEVNHLLAYPRYFRVVGGDVITSRYYNYGDSARYFEFFLVGVAYIVGTEPFHPQLDPGKPPKLEKDEALWLGETIFEGKIWRVVKNIPIPKEGWERYHPPLYLPREVE